IGNVSGLDALIVDDFTTTCGSLADVAHALEGLGARSVKACVSHCLLDERGLARLDASPLRELIVTDSVQNEAAAAHPKIRVVSVSGLLAEAIKRIHTGESVSRLFT
ncbi:MAG: ribose-phosphate pyrophosphokinase, partial [Chloroflexi bacterium]